MQEKIGIIAEYNPLHNGHLYHIKKIKEMYPNAIIILVLNGYFLQRGEVSIETKEEKTKLALLYGVDLVIELPFVFGCQSADTFALHSIEILNALGVTRMIFGSESNDIGKLMDIAKKQQEESTKEKLQQELNLGKNYPTALSIASHSDISSPNDLLGISYCKAVMETNSNIKLESILRTNSYHDKESKEEVISASNIREKYKNGEDVSYALPKQSLNCLKKIDENKLFELLKYAIITSKDLSVYLDVDEGIESRILKYITSSTSLDDFIAKIKTKRYTYNRIRRMLIHILIGLTKKERDTFSLDSIKILGMNKKGKKYIKAIKKDVFISLERKQNHPLYQYELKCALIYDMIMHTNTYAFEIQNKPIILDD